MAIALAARPRDGNANKRAKSLEVSKGSGAATEEIYRRQVTAGRLRKTVTDPVGGLDGKRMQSGAEVRKFKEDASKTKTRAPHAFHIRVLLGGTRNRRVVSDLFSGKEVSKIVRHKLATLVRGNCRGCYAMICYAML